MRRLERQDDETVTMHVALRGHQASVWTALPGIIQSFNAAKMTVEVKPAVQVSLLDINGDITWVALPLLVDCPVVFPGGGGYTLTFPIAAGDECLVVFASRCIDSWWEQGGAPQPPEVRMHDLSDGFVIVGPRSVPRALSSISTTDVVLRSDDGTAKISIKANKDIAFTTTANVTMNAAQVNITGAVNITGDVATTGALTNNGVSVGSTHKHSSAATDGLNSTGNPT